MKSYNNFLFIIHYLIIQNNVLVLNSTLNLIFPFSLRYQDY